MTPERKSHEQERRVRYHLVTTKTAYQPAWRWIDWHCIFMWWLFTSPLSLAILYTYKAVKWNKRQRLFRVWAIYICTCDAPTECSRFEFCSCWVARRPGVLLHSQRVERAPGKQLALESRFSFAQSDTALSAWIKRACRQHSIIICFT